MTPFLFARDQFGEIRAGQLTGALGTASESIRVGSIRRLFRWYLQDGERVVERTEDVVTVLSVTLLEVEKLSKRHAKACGVRSAPELRMVWQREHPRSPMVQFVEFAWGDRRDMPRFLAATSSMRWGPTAATRHSKPKGSYSLDSGQGDYTSSRRIAIDDAEVLRPEEQVVVTAEARQRELARRAELAEELASASLVDRVARLQAAGLRLRGEVRGEARRRNR